MSSLLTSLHALGAEALAIQLAQTLGHLSAAQERETVELSAALLVQERARGHASVDLQEWAGRTVLEEPSSPSLPDRANWQSSLERSGLLNREARPAPLVLDENGRLYLLRYHRAERRLAAGLRRRLGAIPEAGSDPDALGPLFRALFPTPAHGDPQDGQALAAAAALRHRLLVITGGPGTGKTTTIVRILGLLLARNPDLRIALAAPTGKAAARLSGSLQDQLLRLPIPSELRARIPTTVRTLHRLLGYQHARRRFLFGSEQSLVADVVVVDEASMVDLLLMDALVAALQPEAQLILVGDADQLASVDAGYVLGDIVTLATAEVASPEFARWCVQLGGGRPAVDPEASPWCDAVIRLRKSYRFAEGSPLAALIASVRDGREDELRELLEKGGESGELWWMDRPVDMDELLERLAPALRDLCVAEDPRSLLQAQERFRILTPLRRGRWGVDTLNQMLDGWSRRMHEEGANDRLYGRPILITQNDPELDLWNGDLGVLAKDPETGGLRAWFRSGEQLRGLDPYRLPGHELAWALTVHKAQGSEFGEIALLLPPQGSRLLSRELLYTALSRARYRVGIVAPWPVMQEALSRSSARPSGLAARLRD